MSSILLINIVITIYNKNILVNIVHQYNIRLFTEEVSLPNPITPILVISIREIRLFTK